MRTWCAAIVVAALAWPQAGRGAAPEVAIAPGAGSFVFVDRKGDASKRMTVYTYVPQGVAPGAARIVFVLHGAGRNADGYRDAWIAHADRHGFMVIAPRFDRTQWGQGTYSYASIFAGDGRFQEPSLWSCSVVEHLFDAVREATGNRSPRYWLYGHSEGGQYVHRLVLLLPEARYVRAVAANAGWYTMPRFDVAYPYGLGGSPVTEASLRKSLARDVVILLGEADTDPLHPQLRRTPEAMAQGAHRLERGRNYFKTASSRAAELAVEFGWRIGYVAGAGHQNSRMAGAAADLLMQ